MKRGIKSGKRVWHEFRGQSAIAKNAMVHSSAKCHSRHMERGVCLHTVKIRVWLRNHYHFFIWKPFINKDIFHPCNLFRNHLFFASACLARAHWRIRPKRARERERERERGNITIVSNFSLWQQVITTTLSGIVCSVRQIEQYIAKIIAL